MWWRFAAGDVRLRTLVEAGYQPEVALRCLHELRLIVDLMYEGGHCQNSAGRCRTPLSTATTMSGPRVIDPSKANTKDVLTDIQNGNFAALHRRSGTGAPEFKARCAEKGETHPIGATGQELRKLMSWVDSGDDDCVTGTAAR